MILAKLSMDSCLGKNPLIKHSFDSKQYAGEMFCRMRGHALIMNDRTLCLQLISHIRLLMAKKMVAPL